MADQVEIRLAKTRINEGSGFVATAYFRNREAATSDTPASIRYRIDCLTTCQQILGWTTGAPGASLAIQVTGAQNAIQSECNDYEVKQLTVESDTGAADQCRGTAEWRVTNIRRVT